MKTKLLWILFALMILPLVNAEVQTLGTFKYGDCIILKQTCSNCTYNNITSILYPNSSLAVVNVAMTKSGTEYNYTFCNTTELGNYIVNGFGDLNGVVTVWAYDFNITTTGKGDGNVLPLFLLLGAIIIFITASFIKNEYIGLLAGFLFIVSGIYMMIYGLGIFADMYTRAIAFISLGIGLMVSFIAVVEMFYTDLGLGIVGGGRDND